MLNFSCSGLLADFEEPRLTEEPTAHNSRRTTATSEAQQKVKVLKHVSSSASPGKLS
jgi:hypothetical protein